MLKFFKILILLALILALTAIGAYWYYRDKISTKINEEIAQTLADLFKSDVEISGISYIPFQTISVKKLTILNKTTKAPKYHAEDIRVNVDILTMIKNRDLRLILDIKNIDIHAAAFSDNNSKAAPQPAKTASPGKLIKEKLGLKEAEAALHISTINLKTDKKENKNTSVDNLNGNILLDLKHSSFNQGRISFKYENNAYYLLLKKNLEMSDAFDIDLKTEKASLASTVVLENKNLVIIMLMGTIDILGVELSGKVMNFLSPERHGYLEGILTTDLKKLGETKVNIPEKFKTLPLSGELYSKFTLNFKDPDIRACSLESRLTAKNIIWDKIRIDQLNARICLEDNTLILPSIHLDLYEGSISGKVRAKMTGISNISVTYIDVNLKHINIGSLINSSLKTKNNIGGYIDGTLYLDKNPLTRTPSIDPGNKPIELLNFISQYKGELSFELSKPSFNNIKPGKITGKVYIDNGTFFVPSFYGDFYKGTYSADLAMRIDNKDLPYKISFVAKNVSYQDLMASVKQKASSLYGILDAHAYMEGLASDSSAAKGEGTISVKEANLGPMPLLAPLVGNLYTSLQNIISPGSVILIDSAEAGFTIKDRKIYSDDIKLWGHDVYITATGYVDFDGNLDFSFQNQFIDEQSEENENWQNILRNSIVSFGKKISKARLRGTIQNPQWDFEYLVSNIISDNIQKFFKGISQ